MFRDELQKGKKYYHQLTQTMTCRGFVPYKATYLETVTFIGFDEQGMHMFKDDKGNVFTPILGNIYRI